LIGEEGDVYKISQNPYAPDVIRNIPKNEVTGTKMSTLSLMPPSTINRLNDEEVKDLLAYMISGGNPDNPIYEPAEGQAGN